MQQYTRPIGAYASIHKPQWFICKHVQAPVVYMQAYTSPSGAYTISNGVYAGIYKLQWCMCNHIRAPIVHMQTYTIAKGVYASRIPPRTNSAGTNPAGTNPARTNPAGTNPAGTNPAGTNSIWDEFSPGRIKGDESRRGEMSLGRKDDVDSMRRSLKEHSFFKWWWRAWDTIEADLSAKNLATLSMYHVARNDWWGISVAEQVEDRCQQLNSLLTRMCLSTDRVFPRHDRWSFRTDSLDPKNLSTKYCWLNL